MKSIYLKKSNTAFMTTVFPSCMDFFDDFMMSLISQTDNDFDLLVINDGVENFESQTRKYEKINIIEIASRNSIVENRKAGIEMVLHLDYEYLIFGDSDDYFDYNRIDVSKKVLKKYDIVVNDLSLFDAQGVYSELYFSTRIKDMFDVDLEFILNKNIFGLSNTALRVNILKDLSFCENLIAFDWYLFSKLLNENKKAVFTNKTQTFYRQYDDNTAGLGENSIESIKRAIRVKRIHYQCMLKISDFFDKLLSEINYLEVNIENVDFNIDKVKQMNLLWWEIPNHKINN